MTLDFDTALKSASFALSVGAMVFSFVVTRRKDVDQRLTDLERRTALTEQTLEGLPGSSDMHQLHLGMAELRGDLREMRAVMEGNQKIMVRLEDIVTRHEQHLLGAAAR